MLSKLYQLSTTDLSLAHTGFAVALAQVGLPPLSIPMTLLFFNIGVEIGQLIFIAATLAVISQRTKDALAVAKSRGVVLGRSGPANLRPNIEERQRAANAFAERLRPILGGMTTRGLTQRDMTEDLNAIGVPARRGGVWRLAQVQRVHAQH